MYIVRITIFLQSETVVHKNHELISQHKIQFFFFRKFVIKEFTVAFPFFKSTWLVYCSVQSPYVGIKTDAFPPVCVSSDMGILVLACHNTKKENKTLSRCDMSAVP